MEEPPKIMIFGLPKAGKSSIAKVVFHKMAPHETVVDQLMRL